MSLAARLWDGHAELAQASRDTPFVRGLADGSLPREAFAFYVGQDAFFLGAFARAYSVAAATAPDDQTFRAFHELAGGVLDELRLHGSYASDWGVSLDAIVPARATTQYTEFLLRTAWESGPGVTAAAMAPCMRLYAQLGSELARDGIPGHDYGPWIAMYSGAEFEALARRLEALLDTLAPPEPAARAAYREAMECELEFFEAATTV